MRITLNLASKPFADIGPMLHRTRILIGVLALLAIALGAGVYAMRAKAAAARHREESVDDGIAKLQQERQGYTALMRQPDNAAVLDQSEALNRLIDQKSFSWTLAMEDLETVLPGGVQVTTLEPIRDKKDGHITVRMRVVGPRDKAVDLVKNLEHSRRFLQPRIIGESMESSNAAPGQAIEPVSASNRVNFDVLADYNPATREERKAANRKAAANARKEADANGTPAETGAENRRGPGMRRPPYTGQSHPVSPQRPVNSPSGAPR